MAERAITGDQWTRSPRRRWRHGEGKEGAHTQRDPERTKPELVALVDKALALPVGPDLRPSRTTEGAPSVQGGDE